MGNWRCSGMDKRWAGGVLVGQLLAIAGSLGGAAMQALGDMNLPMIQVAGNYALLFVAYGLVMLYCKQGLQAPWYHFFGLALCDTLATYLTISGMKYTSATSWAMLSSLGAIICLPLSYLLLGSRYKCLHYVGVALTLLGAILLIIFDKIGPPITPNPLVGDTLVLFGTFLYAANSIWVEKVLKNGVPQYAVLWAMSGFGFCFSSPAIFLLGEHKPVFAPTTDVLLGRVGAILAQFLLYSCMPIVVGWSGSMVMQLSLLSMTIWAVPLRLAFFGRFGGYWWVFAISVVLSYLGIYIYTSTGDVNASRLDYKRVPHDEATSSQDISENEGLELTGGCGQHGA